MNKAKDKTAKTMTARIQLFFMFVCFFFPFKRVSTGGAPSSLIS